MAFGNESSGRRAAYEPDAPVMKIFMAFTAIQVYDRTIRFAFLPSLGLRGTRERKCKSVPECFSIRVHHPLGVNSS